MSTVASNSRHLLIITVCTAIATTVIATLIVVSIGLLISCTNRHFFVESKCAAKLERQNPSILALTVVSIFSNIYMFSMSLAALISWENSRHNALISDLLNLDEINYINRSLIGLLFVFDTISMVCSISVYCLVTAFLFFKDSHKIESALNCCFMNKDDHKRIRIFRLISVICACLSLCAHFPYISVAYLNNEYHANGIFIYYSLLGCLLFGLSWIAFHYYYNSQYHNEDENNDSKCKHKFLLVFALFFIVCMTLTFIVILTCYFLMIPIVKSISEFPNRITGIYMSGGFVISTYFLYKLFVYLCRKNKQHRNRSNPSPNSEQIDVDVKRVSTRKLEDAWRDRTESERKCDEFIALERIKEGIQTVSVELQKKPDNIISATNPRAETDTNATDPRAETS